MKRKKIVAMLSALTVATTLLGNFNYVNAETNSQSKAEQIVAEMTLDEKIGQMLMPDFRLWKQNGEAKEQNFTEMNEEVAAIIEEFDLGGVILFAQNVKTTEQTTKLVHDMQEIAVNDDDGNLPLLITIDQEGGIVTRLGTGTNFPGNMALGATKNEQSAYDTAEVIAKELDALGINVNFAPSVDVNNNPSNPVIGLRSFSSDPELVGDLGVAMINGLQDNGVSAAAKHFPGHGDTATDSHYGLPRVDKSLEELKEVELKPFQDAIDNGVDMIMTAHIQYPQIETDKHISKKDGQEMEIPATLSDNILTGLLREDMNYDGVIITDALNMEAISENFGEAEAVVMAIKAGADIALMPAIIREEADVQKLRDIVDGVKAAVASNEITEESINESVARIVKLKIDRGIMDVENDTRTVEEKVANANAVVGCDEHREVERRVSAEAITVVKNEDNILPLNPKEGENVLLVAPYANELPGMQFGLTRIIAEEKVNSVNIDTYCYKSQATMTDELKAKIDAADYVVVLSEMGRYTHLASTHWITAIPNAVTAYANELNKDSVVVSVGKPYDVAAHTEAKAEVVAYGYVGMDPTEADGGLTPTQAFGPNIPAAIEVIFGAAEAQGTLPVDIPVVDENGNPDLTVNAYEFGYGITNLTSVGSTSIELPKEVEHAEDLEVKINITELENLTSGDYSAKIKFNNNAFEVVSVKSSNENIEVKNFEVKDSEINVSLSGKDVQRAVSSEVALVVTLTAIGQEATNVNTIDSVQIVDAKGRTYTTTFTNSSEDMTINITKAEVDNAGSDNNTGTENNTGSGSNTGTNNNTGSSNNSNSGSGNNSGSSSSSGSTSNIGSSNNTGSSNSTSSNNNTASTNTSTSKLPNTGAVVTPVATGIVGLAITALGFVLNKKRNKK